MSRDQGSGCENEETSILEMGKQNERVNIKQGSERGRR